MKVIAPYLVAVLGILIPFSSLQKNEGDHRLIAYLVAVLGGNTSPSANDIKNILASEVGFGTCRWRRRYIPCINGTYQLLCAGDGATALTAKPKKEEKVEEKGEYDDENPDLWKWLTLQEPPLDSVSLNPVFSAVQTKVMNNLNNHAAPETRAVSGQPWVTR
ncbi:hypothetical protein Dimus_030616 [Dionaea muscipula]